MYGKKLVYNTEGCGIMLEHDVGEVIITEEQLEKRVKELGDILTDEYAGKNPLFICPLKGSVIFFADLLRKIKIPCEIDFMAVSSYNSNTVSSGNVKILKDLACDIGKRHVIIIEDIIDSGNTLSKLKSLLEKRSPASLKICTLLDKPSRRVKSLNPDYCGFTIPDLFVIGYGMDLNEEYRNLPYIGVYSNT